MLSRMLPKAEQANSRGYRCVHVAVEEIDVVVSHPYLSVVDRFAERYRCHVLSFGIAGHRDYR